MSTWNMPPGVTTNDIPGNNSDSEALEAAYIAECGDDGAETIADAWADALVLHTSRNRERRREVIRGAIVAALETNMSELEIAETAADILGNLRYEDWCQQQEEVR